MLATLQTTNLALRLCLELALLVALGAWAWRSTTRRAARVAAAGAVPLAAAVAWGAFVHGELVPSVTGVLVQIVLFGAAAAALVSLHRPRLAVAFLAAVVANAGLMALWGQ